MKHALKLTMVLLFISTHIYAQDPHEQIVQLEKRVNQLITMLKEQSKQINELSDSTLKLQEQLKERGDFEGNEPQGVVNLDENDEEDMDENEDGDMLP